MCDDLCRTCGGPNTGPAVIAPSIAARRSLCIDCAKAATSATCSDAPVPFRSLRFLMRAITRRGNGDPSSRVPSVGAA